MVLLYLELSISISWKLKLKESVASLAMILTSTCSRNSYNQFVKSEIIKLTFDIVANRCLKISAIHYSSMLSENRTEGAITMETLMYCIWY